MWVCACVSAHVRLGHGVIAVVGLVLWTVPSQDPVAGTLPVYCHRQTSDGQGGAGVPTNWLIGLALDIIFPCSERVSAVVPTAKVSWMLHVYKTACAPSEVEKLLFLKAMTIFSVAKGTKAIFANYIYTYISTCRYNSNSRNKAWEYGQSSSPHGDGGCVSCLFIMVWLAVPTRGLGLLLVVFVYVIFAKSMRVFEALRFPRGYVLVTDCLWAFHEGSQSCLWPKGPVSIALNRSRRLSSFMSGAEDRLCPFCRAFIFYSFLFSSSFMEWGSVSFVSACLWDVYGTEAVSLHFPPN